MPTNDLSGEAQQAIAAVANAAARRQVLSALCRDGPARANELTEAVDVSRTSVHRGLNVLKEVGCVKSITPDAESWNVYAATDLGETVHGVVGDE
jgi:predicted ArsR family transcriptional regulator